jgi:hypothetical protein
MSCQEELSSFDGERSDKAILGRLAMTNLDGRPFAFADDSK